MAYSKTLAVRVRQAFQGERGIVEKQMFGGLGFLLFGNLCVGVWKESLIARIGPEEYATALQEPHVREFDVTGRPMKGWVLVQPEALESDRQIAAWVERSLQFVSTLPRK